MTEANGGLAALLARAESRRPWTPDDTKSGARFERVVIGGESFVLKYQDPRDDWLLRASGDPGRAYVRLWESGLLGRLPPEIDHAVVAADYDGEVGRVLLRDVGTSLLEPDTPFTAMQHARYMEHMAALHAAFWGWHDDVGLTPLERRYLLLSPQVAAAEAARGTERGRAPGHGRRVAVPPRSLARHGEGRVAAPRRPLPPGGGASAGPAHVGPR